MNWNTTTLNTVLGEELATCGLTMETLKQNLIEPQDEKPHKMETTFGKPVGVLIAPHTKPQP